ncbi:hypothetical protein [Hoyosella altamirensis]|uniref:Uncharacterized protein n=1 Tax=Hoyosella altamirensis TaxID=616997 RepID=A0A839RIH5_9ACTN|nr:hypothetical protein [Hoyosella altamirensis]MBB3036612.1 hypothetical protein [Hoyosella altamirensis]
MTRFRSAAAKAFLIAAPIALMVGGASFASAVPNTSGPSGYPGYCAVEEEDADGNVRIKYVPTGTRSGPLVCGADGEWEIVWKTGNTGSRYDMNSTGGVYLAR